MKGRGVEVEVDTDTTPTYYLHARYDVVTKTKTAKKKNLMKRGEITWIG